jgi:hypothetical protein
MDAAWYNRVKEVKALIKFKAIVNAKNKDVRVF